MLDVRVSQLVGSITESAPDETVDLSFLTRNEDPSMISFWGYSRQNVKYEKLFDGGFDYGTI